MNYSNIRPLVQKLTAHSTHEYMSVPYIYHYVSQLCMYYPLTSQQLADLVTFSEVLCRWHASLSSSTFCTDVHIIRNQLNRQHNVDFDRNTVDL